jgi:hypothetical protein
MNLYATQKVVPSASHLVQKRIYIRLTVTVNQEPFLFSLRCLTKKPGNLGALACFQLNRQLKGRARIETGSDLPG